jgi:hypothetical protein
MNVLRRRSFALGRRTAPITLIALCWACPSQAADKGGGAPASEKSEASAAPSAGDEAQVIIWGGGSTRADAEKALAEWNAEKSALSGVLTIADGFPKIVESKTVPGLKPGFHVVILGACPDAALESPLRAIQGLRSGVYVRRAALPGGGNRCPTGDRGFEALDLERVKTGGMELTFLGFLASNSKEDPIPFVYRFILRDAQGKLIDWEEENGKKDETYDCDMPDAEKGVDRFTLKFDCLGSDGTGPALSKSKVTVSFAIAATTIDIKVVRDP